MKPVNLIPVRRILARQRQRHVRRCVVICSTWGFVVVGVCAAGQGLVPGGRAAGDGGLQERLDRVGREIDVQEQAVASVRGEMSAAQATLRATRTIADQPDWSALLALIARTTGDDVMLRSLDLNPIAPIVTGPKPGSPARPGQPAANAKPAGFVVSAGGLAQSQLAVTQFMLRLERLGLFSRVTLLDTSREPFRDVEATSFRVECVIDASPQQQQQAADAGRTGRR